MIGTEDNFISRTGIGVHNAFQIDENDTFFWNCVLIHTEGLHIIMSATKICIQTAKSALFVKFMFINVSKYV